MDVKRLPLIYFSIFLLLIGTFQTMAQEETETPSPPTATQTLTSTTAPTLTHTATSTSTSTATSSPTSTETSAATSSPTSTVTATSSSTSTETATSTTVVTSTATSTATSTSEATLIPTPEVTEAVASDTPEPETTQTSSQGANYNLSDIAETNSNSNTNVEASNFQMSQQNLGPSQEFFLNFDGTSSTGQTIIAPADYTIGIEDSRTDTTLSISNCTGDFAPSANLMNSLCYKYLRNGGSTGAFTMPTSILIDLSSGTDRTYTVNDVVGGVFGFYYIPDNINLPHTREIILRDSNDVVLYHLFRTCTTLPTLGCTNQYLTGVTSLPVSNVETVEFILSADVNATSFNEVRLIVDNLSITAAEELPPTPTPTPTGIVCPSGSSTNSQQVGTQNDDTCPNPTPTPQVTPTEPPTTYTCDVAYTNMDLCNLHRFLRAGIFFAIYNETSEDRVYSGHETELQYPTYTNELIETLTADDAARTATSFLIQTPYCENGSNLASDEPPTVAWQSSDIIRVEHCFDHRYLDANVIINGYLSYERRLSLGINPTNVRIFNGSIYGYLARNFGGTFGPTAGENPLWSEANLSECYDTFTNHPVSLPRSGENRQNEFVEYETLSEVFATIRSITYETDTSAYPGRYRIQGLAMEWISEYLDCILSDGVVTNIDLKYERINTQIENAIRDFYNGLSDPTNGAFYRRAPNVQEVAIVLEVGSITLDASIVNQYYSNSILDNGCLSPTRNQFPDIFQYVDILQCYVPEELAIVQPVLRVDINNSGFPTVFAWEGVSYGIPDSGCIYRYTTGDCE